MKAFEKGYVAGFLDGEGSITIAKRKHKDCINNVYDLRVQVTGTDKIPLEWFKEKFGGSIMLRLNTGLKNKPLYQYCIAARKALKMLVEVYPYLLIKKQLAEIAILFQSEKMKMSLGRCRSKEEIEFFNKCREKVLELNFKHTEKGAKRHI